MFVWPLLSMVMLTPLLGAFVIAITGGREKVLRRNTLCVASLTTTVCCVFSILVCVTFDINIQGLQLQETTPVMESVFFTYTVGVDGISLLFLLMTSFLSVVYAIAMWHFSLPRIKEYTIAFLCLESMIIGVFIAQNVLMFFLFLQGGIVSACIMIGILGGKRIKSTAFRVLLAIFFASLLLLAAFLSIVFQAKTGYMPQLKDLQLPKPTALFVWWVLFTGFAVFLPVFPLHTWYVYMLRTVPVPVMAFIIVMLTKVGFYGVLRFSIEIFPQLAKNFSPIVLLLSVISIVYAIAKVITTQEVKQRIGYMAMAVMNIIVMAMFMLTYQSMVGATVLSLVFSVSILGVFLVLCFLQERVGNVTMKNMGGLFQVIPHLSIAYLLMALSIAAIPMAGGFPSLIILLSALFKEFPLQGFFVAVVYVSTVVGILNTHRVVFWGEVPEDLPVKIQDMQWKEKLVVSLIVGSILWIGIAPNTIIRPIEKNVWNVTSTFFT